MKHVALIGYGYWGKTIARYIRASPDFFLKYIYFRSLKQENADEVAGILGPVFEPSLGKILNDPEVVGLLIATPIDTHYRLCYDALIAGKHVFAEKPLTLVPGQAAELGALARDKGLVLVTDYTNTFSPGLGKAAAIVQAGGIGDVQQIHISWAQSGRFNDYDVYALLGSHALSILNMFIPLSRCHFSLHPKILTNRRVTEADITFLDQEDRVSGIIEISLHSPRKKREVIVKGQKGVIIFSQLESPVLKKGFYDRRKMFHVEESSDFDEANNVARGIKFFHEAIMGEVKSNIDLSLKITELLSQWQESA